MADFSIASRVQPYQAPNVLGVAEHVQKMQTSNMLMQQRAAELQKENALTTILGRSGGQATPDVIKGLIASGNYEPALALQRHAASMGAMGVQTQAAQTALEKSRLELGETKRTLASNDAARNFIIQNEDLTNPEALTKLRQVNPGAFQEIAKFNTAMNKAQYEAAREGRLSEDTTLKLFKSTAETFAPLIASSDEKSFYPLYDRLAKLSEPFAQSVPREFTPQNVSNIVKIAEDLKNAKYETVGGVPGIVDMRSGTFKPLALNGAGANATLNQQTTVTPNAPPAAAMMAQPATPQNMEQFLAAAAERKEKEELKTFRRKEEIKQEVGRELTPVAEQKLRTEVGDARANAQESLATAQGVLDAAKDLRAIPDSEKGKILGYTGKYSLNLTDAAKNVQTKFNDIKGQVIAMGKASAGSIGSMAVQEWKILADQIVTLETENLTPKSLNDQLDIIVRRAEGLMKRTKSNYTSTYDPLIRKYEGQFDLSMPEPSPEPKKAETPAAPARGQRPVNGRPPLSSFGGG
jgi:hypothetical protein